MCESFLRIAFVRWSFSSCCIAIELHNQSDNDRMSITYLGCDFVSILFFFSFFLSLFLLYFHKGFKLYLFHRLYLVSPRYWSQFFYLTRTHRLVPINFFFPDEFYHQDSIGKPFRIRDRDTRCPSLLYSKLYPRLAIIVITWLTDSLIILQTEQHSSLVIR